MARAKEAAEAARQSVEPATRAASLAPEISDASGQCPLNDPNQRFCIGHNSRSLASEHCIMPSCRPGFESLTAKRISCEHDLSTSEINGYLILAFPADLETQTFGVDVPANRTSMTDAFMCEE